MINNIQRYFERHIGGTGSARNTVATDPDRRLHIAAAALLIEMARIDYSEEPEEMETISKLLQSDFGINQSEINELISLASDETDNMTSYHKFTTTINKECDVVDKTNILKLLWRIAFVDGRIDKYEEHMIRKIANLIYIPREQQVAAKRAAEKEIKNSG